VLCRPLDGGNEVGQVFCFVMHLIWQGAREVTGNGFFPEGGGKGRRPGLENPAFRRAEIDGEQG